MDASFQLRMTGNNKHKLRWELFAQHYVRTRNLVESVWIAGYTPAKCRTRLKRKRRPQSLIRKWYEERGKELLRRFDIAIRINYLMQNPKELITVEQVILGLKREAELMEAEGGKSAVRVKAWQLLGVYLGMFVKKVQIEPGSELQITEKIVASPNDNRTE